jgi:hypothetical protein
VQQQQQQYPWSSIDKGESEARCTDFILGEKRARVGTRGERRKVEKKGKRVGRRGERRKDGKRGKGRKGRGEDKGGEERKG